MSVVQLHPDQLGVRRSGDGSPPAISSELSVRPKRIQQRPVGIVTPTPITTTTTTTTSTDYSSRSYGFFGYFLDLDIVEAEDYLAIIYQCLYLKLFMYC